MDRRLPATVAGLMLACLLVPAAVRADSVTLTPIHDNTLFQDNTGEISNGSGPALFAGKTATGSVRRALLKFDLSGIANDATVDSAKLVLHVSKVTDTTPRTMTLHHVAADWGEGISFTSSGSGTQAETNDATWIDTFYPGTPWSTPGGDFDETASASAVVGIATGFATWFGGTGSGLVTDLQMWVAQANTNHGWALLGEEAANHTARKFDSRESTAANRPQLTVWYSTNVPVMRDTWGRLKDRYR